MIPYPSVKALLAKHGNTAKGRAAARKETLDYMIDQARRAAEQAGRSFNCQTGHHADPRPGWSSAAGCRNDGSTCICSCHDPKETTTGEAVASR